MTGISKLYCGAVEVSDVLRYRRQSAELPSHLLQFAADKKPVVVWNCTQACNLRCRHCYAGEKFELECELEKGRKNSTLEFELELKRQASNRMRGV